MGILENEEVAGRVRWHAVDMVEREDRWMRERAIEGLPLLAEIDHRHHSFDSCLPSTELVLSCVLRTFVQGSVLCRWWFDFAGEG
jgi:hypothetical protein